MPCLARFAHHLQIGDRRARRFEQRRRFGPGVIGGEGSRLAARPAARGGVARHQHRQRQPFVGLPGAIGKVAAAEFEQADAARAALRIARRRHQQSGQQRGAHDLQILADRIGQRPCAAADRLGLVRRDEAPRHRFVEATRGGGAAQAALQPLFGRCGRRGDAGRAGQGGGGHLVDALDPDHFLDQIGGTVDVAAPAGRGDAQRVEPVVDPDRIAIGVERFDGEAQPFEDVALPRRRNGEAAQRLRQRRIIADRGADLRRGPGARHAARLSAAQVDHQPRRDRKPVVEERRIDPAFEPGARIRCQDQLLPGAGDRFGIEPGAFDDDIGGGFAAPRMFAAHDAANVMDRRIVGDHRHYGVERIGLAVERQHLFARACLARDQAAGQLGAVIDMERAPQIDADIIGNVDQRRNRLLPDRLQPLLHPVGRGAVGDAADRLREKGGAARGIVGAHVGTGAVARDRIER